MIRLTPLPMVADFALRLAGGLAAMLLLAPRSVVPPAFFRTHTLVILGLFVGAALAEGRAASSPVMATTIAGAVAAYLASAFWGMGLPRLAIPATVFAAIAGLGLVVWWDGSGPGSLAALNASSRLASAAVLGATLSAMLLGHHYLTAPAMSIAPLRAYVGAMGLALAVRTALAGAALAIWLGGRGSPGAGAPLDPLFLGMRWGMGIAGPAIATFLAWKTVQIRSTQSATGILYVAITLVLFGELAGLILGRGAGLEF